MLNIEIGVSDSSLTKTEEDIIHLAQSAQTDIQINPRIQAPISEQVLDFLRRLSIQLGNDRISSVLDEAVQQCLRPSDFGGYEMSENGLLTPSQDADVVFLVSAYLEALKTELQTRNKPAPLDYRPESRRRMTMTEKIFAMHDVSRRGYVVPGDVVEVEVDRVLASELSFGGSIEHTYDRLEWPGIFRNDRFCLAGDHRVEPALYDRPAVKHLMEVNTQAQKEMKLTEFQGFNYTIMYTEFVRDRVQPGMLIIGADSHSCLPGAESCLSIGMGGMDVCMSLITGKSWFLIPETVRIRLINALPKGIGGKDVISYIL